MTRISCYPPSDRQRFVAEAHKRGQRTDFERDRARILHSSALRRLGAKTQVLGPTADDFSRTRLTHSLEVAQVGRELGQGLGCDPDVVDAACLAHDLGHPPFGHAGERILNEIAGEIGGFEGNAQTWRLITRLEPKVVAVLGLPDSECDSPAVNPSRGQSGSTHSCAGLNLTRATLDAIAKYPWLKGEGPRGSLDTKYSVYPEDAAVFSWMRHGCPPQKRCLEAQVMDLSDDIAYSIHDLEDAVALGTADLGQLDDDARLAELIAATQQWYGMKFSGDELAGAYARLRHMPFWVTSPATDYQSKAALKDMTSQLIGRFSLATHDATRARYGNEPLTRYQADLVIPAQTAAEIQLLKGIAVFYVMAPREHDFDHLSSQQLLADLTYAVWERQLRGEKILEEPYYTDWLCASDCPQGRDAGRLRAVVDQVASLTDLSARSWHARLLGMISRPV